MSDRSEIFRLALDLEVSNHEYKRRFDKIEGVIKQAEDWCDKQLLPETEICIAALKDIRRIMR